MRQLPEGDGPPAWRVLSDKEFDVAWSKHSTVPGAGTPSRTFRVPDDFDSRRPEVQALLDEFHRALLHAFQSCLPRGRKMVALDYHHPSHEFDPHALTDDAAAGHWPVTVLPEGDDTIYVADDQSFGTSASWNPEKLTVFGKALLEHLDRKLPKLLAGWEVVPATGSAPYGSWSSPVTTELIVGETITLGQPSFLHGELFWTETRPKDGGRTVLVRGGHDVTPAPFNVRTRVNEYGGGAYLAGPEAAWFSNDGDKRVYAIARGQAPKPVTPAGKMRFADFEHDPKRGRLVCVREDHNVVGTQAETTLAALPLDRETEGTVLVRGSDFYSSPRLSPDGSQLAWLSWNHPNMPWDGTELRVANVKSDGSLGEARLVAGGPEESIYQPEWSPDGVLHFVSDRTGFWNLYREGAGGVEALSRRNAEFGRPQWNFGSSTYGFDSAHRIVCLFCEHGTWHLGLLDTRTKQLEEVKLPFTEMKALRTAPGRAAFLAGSPTDPEALVTLDLASRKTEVVRRSSVATVDAAFFSPAVPIEFPTAGGLSAHALYYAPRNRDFIGSTGLPPLIVDCHGGPTSAATSTLDLELQFWTSRGFAVVDVNYGGSTGYGRAYRERLNGKWGIVDVEDCEAAARHLVARGLADPNRVVIRGGSAGGYTALRALTKGGVFTAGTSYYGIGDLEVLADDYGHKFEWKYSVRLVGPWPEARALYRERSPVHEAGRIAAPVLFLQGLDDVVCPPCQTEVMVDALRKRGAPFAYLAFEKEGHGFRRAETIRRAIEAELSFYARVFGIDPAGGAAQIPFEGGTGPA